MLKTATSLFSPLTLRNLTLKNRIVVAPMCQYSAKHGFADDWHFAHLSRFALGGFSLVITEATAVSPEGRISYADLGLWSDEQIPALNRIVNFLHSQGTAAGIQLAHAGRKASTPVPFRPVVDDEQKEAIAFEDWQPIAPSAVIHSEKVPGFKQPKAMDLDDIAALKADFVAAVHRAEKAGFDVIEIHAAHGYLLNQFLSPLANKRDDIYGGSFENRTRLLLELTKDVRAVWPTDKPLFVRISASDNHPDGWTIEDSVELARQLKSLGVDLIHCSSGGFDGAAFSPKAHYQVALSAQVREQANIATAAVGLITDPKQADGIIANGEADLVALARAALDDPQWPLHAKLALTGSEDAYSSFPQQSGYAVKAKDRSLKQRSFAE